MACAELITLRRLREACNWANMARGCRKDCYCHWIDTIIPAKLLMEAWTGQESLERGHSTHYDSCTKLQVIESAPHYPLPQCNQQPIWAGEKMITLTVLKVTNTIACQAKRADFTLLSYFTHSHSIWGSSDYLCLSRPSKWKKCARQRYSQLMFYFVMVIAELVSLWN